MATVLTGIPGNLAAGRRDRRVTVQGLTTITNPDGFPIETWADLNPAIEYMSRRDLRADERFISSAESAYAETQWICSYRADLDPELVDVPNRRRLVYEGRAYDVTAATRINPKAGIELLTLAASSLEA